MCTTASLSDEEFDSIKLVDKRVVASALGVSPRTVEGWVSGRKGGPPFLHVGRNPKWPLPHLREFIKARLLQEARKPRGKKCKKF